MLTGFSNPDAAGDLDGDSSGDRVGEAESRPDAGLGENKKMQLKNTSTNDSAEAFAGKGNGNGQQPAGESGEERGFDRQ